jgi:predicted transposase YdaD
VLTDNPLPPAQLPPAEIRSGDLVILKGYRLVRLWELDAAQWFASERPFLLPYIPLMRGGEQHLTAIAQALSQLPDEDQRKDLSAYFAIMGGLRYDRTVLRQLLQEALMQIPLEDFRQSSIVQAWLEEGLEEGLAKGIARGREEGIARGRAAAVYEMVRRAAARYFPVVSLGSELESITNLEALEDLCLTMHELPDAATLQARLLELMPSNQ